LIETDDWDVLDAAHTHAVAYLKSLDSRRVDATSDASTISSRLPAGLPATGTSALDVLHELVDVFDDGVVASAGGRFFGWVTGGTYPVGVAADWITSAWDQLSGPGPASPAADAAEQVVGRWLTDLLGLPGDAATGLVTGTQMANFTALAAARHALLQQAGWDVERKGLGGAPAISVLAGHDRHVTIDSALRYLGLGTDSLVGVATDNQGRMLADDLAAQLDVSPGLTIVVLGAGNVNTGSFDPFSELVPLAHSRGAWVHVDGAFGLWAAASERTAHLTAGAGEADSWALDAHKWLNAPYDNAAVIVRDRAALLGAMSSSADYLTFDDGAVDPLARVPEMSRRARGFAFYAILHHLGRQGVADLVDRCCANTVRFATELAELPGVTIVNQVVLNQLLIAFASADPGRIAAAVRRSGVAFVTPSRWRGQPVLRISVSGWRTDENDVDATVAAIRASLAEEGAPGF
jgi:glutamate/tyrosine decarboxylase-like PLP-dependent enzyme